jgi:23S rRNA (cytosine1962-C5)-methyltransferase
MKKSTVWRIRAKADKRFRSGHPWVYSNELQESPKGIEPGEPVELQDAGGAFLARGYGNPASLIAFRTVSRDPAKLTPLSPESVLEALISAGRIRKTMGLAEFSHRLCFGEGDGLPGLIIDRFVLKTEPPSQAFVVQMHTAGMDRLQGELPGILRLYAEKMTEINWPRTAVVFRNDLPVRKLEGVREEESRIVHPIAGVDLSDIKILVQEAFHRGAPLGKKAEAVEFSVDLVDGQKTGFFLDQASNIQLAAQKLAYLHPSDGKKVRILDICCYVGQWGVQLARMFRAKGFEVEVLAVDASAQALERAKQNMEALGAGVTCKTMKSDFSALSQLGDHQFDIVVCDPPALIKGRKDIAVGTHAYLQLNTQVFRLVRPSGAVVTCSCSNLLEEAEFVRVLSKASYRNRSRVRWVARGFQSPDHPVLLEFPEGQYLKCLMGIMG